MSTAAAIVVGDEILTGKVRDINAPLIIQLLRAAGVELARLLFIGDDLESIARDVLGCSEQFDYVITSGGIGPTHDDITIPAVARAFGLEVVLDPDLDRMVRGFWGDRYNEAAARLAQVPAGARLLYGDDGLLPLVVVRNVYLLPGIPRLFEAKLKSVEAELKGCPAVQQALYLAADETSVAGTLGQVAREFPQVRIGSYPRLGEPGYRLWVTVEGADGPPVEQALARLLQLLPHDAVVRVDRDGCAR